MRTVNRTISISPSEASPVNVVVQVWRVKDVLREEQQRLSIPLTEVDVCLFVSLAITSPLLMLPIVSSLVRRKKREWVGGNLGVGALVASVMG
jgi:hypothetical protein